MYSPRRVSENVTKPNSSRHSISVTTTYFSKALLHVHRLYFSDTYCTFIFFAASLIHPNFIETFIMHRCVFFRRQPFPNEGLLCLVLVSSMCVSACEYHWYVHGKVHLLTAYQSPENKDQNLMIQIIMNMNLLVDIFQSLHTPLLYSYIISPLRHVSYTLYA